MHKFTLLTLLVDILIFMLSTVLYIDLISGWKVTGELDFIYKTDLTTEDDRKRFAFNFGMIFIPVYFMYSAKVFFGVKMVIKRFKK